VPARQLKQVKDDVAPTVVEYVPAMQLAQEDELLLLEYLPAGQFLQETEL
jgi:hypothetical protein